jgi:hypothetical protein
MSKGALKMNKRTIEDLLAGFFLAVLVALLFFSYLVFSPPDASFDGHNWNCPSGYFAYASERELVENKPFVHCVK